MQMEQKTTTLLLFFTVIFNFLLFRVDTLPERAIYYPEK